MGQPVCLWMTVASFALEFDYLFIDVFMADEVFVDRFEQLSESEFFLFVNQFFYHI